VGVAVTTRRVRTEAYKPAAKALIDARKPPFNMTLSGGADRSTEQNKLQRLWMNELAEQFGDMAAEEYRAFCKLHFAVPIMRAENEEWLADYDLMIKPLPYEYKLKMMAEPMDFPVTRKMTTKQMTQYLDAIYTEFTGRGALLTRPDEGTW